MRTLVAILAMSSCAAIAQKTQSPAQPASTPILQASLHQPVLPSTFAATTSTVPAAELTTTPRLLHSVPFVNTASEAGRDFHFKRSVVLDVAVDANGTPVTVKVLNSNDPLVNNSVIRTVSQYQYEPATQNGVAVPGHVRLTFRINPESGI